MTTPEAHELKQAEHLPREIEENEMYGLAEYEVWRQSHEENRREVAVEHLTEMAREDRKTRPYVVRELSWELARYLDTELAKESSQQHLVARAVGTVGNERRRG